jgi:hypothetical protein
MGCDAICWRWSGCVNQEFLARGNTPAPQLEAVRLPIPVLLFTGGA